MANRVVRGEEGLLAARRGIGRRHTVQKRDVMRAVPRFIEAELFVEFLLFDVRQDEHAPAVERSTIGAVHDGRGQSAVRILIEVESQGNLREPSVNTISGVANAFHS